MTAVAAWEYPAVLAGVLFAICVIGRAIHWVYAWAKRIDASLTYIQGEMSFNGGASLRDESRETRDLLLQHIADCEAVHSPTINVTMNTEGEV